MPTTEEIIVVPKNYSKCPLKKRPIHFTFEENEIKDEPENLSIKKDIKSESDEDDEVEVRGSPAPTIIAVNSNCSDVKSAVIVPTPTYPKLNLQPWNFHIPYTTDFYRNIHHHQHHQHHHLQHQISPLRGDLHSPNTPSSEGSLSPPPQYLNGRSSSISPPIRGDLYRPIGIKPHGGLHPNHNSHIIKPEVIGQHRYVPYHQIPYQPYALAGGFTHHHQPPSRIHQHPPVSPTYSDASSYYSQRSLTPDSPVSLTPEDLSVKPSPTSSNISISSEPENRFVEAQTEIKEKSSAPPRYQCSDCQKSYSTFSGLTKHQQFHCPAAEGNQAKKSFSCKDCDKTYVSLGALKMHIRTHTLPCKCNICGKAFSRPWLLQGHIRTHTGEKPFSCQHCHRAFADRSNLRAHLQTHSDIKKYSCPSCSKTFSRMSLLTKHTEGGCPGTQVNPSGGGFIPTYTDLSDY